jgi:hypothetical protein
MTNVEEGQSPESRPLSAPGVCFPSNPDILSDIRLEVPLLCEIRPATVLSEDTPNPSLNSNI